MNHELFLQKNTKSEKKLRIIFMRTCIILCVKVYFKHNLNRCNIMLNYVDMRILALKTMLNIIIVLFFTALLTVRAILNLCNLLIVALDKAEKLLDWVSELEPIKRVFKYQLVQGLCVFAILSALVFGFLVKTSDALVIESQGRYIADQKFRDQVAQDTPDAIYFSKKERLNE